MQEVHTHRGFTVTVLAEDDPAGGSTVTTRIQRDDGGQPDNGEWAAPRQSRSRFRGACRNRRGARRRAPPDRQRLGQRRPTRRISAAVQIGAASRVATCIASH